MSNNLTKQCSQCHEIKDINRFSKHIRRKDGYSSYCKDCQRKQNLILRDRFMKNNLRNNRIISKICAKCKKEKVIINFSIDTFSKDGYFCWCKSCVSLIDQIKANKNFLNQIIISKKMCTKCNIIQSVMNFVKNKRNIDGYHNWCKSCMNSNTNYRRNNDIIFHLRTGLRSNMNRALNNNYQSGHSIDLLGCSIKNWKIYLSKLFLENMSWNNYGHKDGQWSIDHITPCSLFDLSDPVEQKQCFHYSNTQPMWHIENIRKSNKLLNQNYHNNTPFI